MRLAGWGLPSSSYGHTIRPWELMPRRAHSRDAMRGGQVPHALTDPDDPAVGSDQ
jgi:hypothetical protein